MTDFAIRKIVTQVEEIRHEWGGALKKRVRAAEFEALKGDVQKALRDSKTTDLWLEAARRMGEGDVAGLGLIPGEVLKFDLAGRTQADGSRYKVPQMGWNRVRQMRHGGQLHAMWAGVPDDSYFYFVHSFYARPANPAHCAGQADYGAPFAAAIARDNIFATQFHPEKSAEHGLALYRNFLHWKP